MATTRSIHEIMDKYIRNASSEVLLHEISLSIHYKNAYVQTLRAMTRDCRNIVMKWLNEKDVSYITIGYSRNHVTVHKTGVSSVIFYDCFYLEPEEHNMMVEKQAYDYVCAEFLPVADVYAENHSEYILLVNHGTFKSAFDWHLKNPEDLGS